MNISNAIDQKELDAHVNLLDGRSIEECLQLAAAAHGGTMQAKLAGAAIATIVARFTQLSEADQKDLFDCIKDLGTISSQADAYDTMKSILEILDPSADEFSTVELDPESSNRSRDEHVSWLSWISAKIKNLREERGMTQIELAQSSGLQQSHISRLESGQHSPSHKTLSRLANALGVDVGQLSLQ